MTTTTAPVAPVAPVEVKSEAPAVYTPSNYQPAPLSYPHNPVYNLVVPEYEHHKIKHIPVKTKKSLFQYGASAQNFACRK